MAVLEALRMALSAMRANKLRTTLTLLGMVIGVFAIIVSVTAVKVIDVYFKESLQFLGASTFTISREPLVRVNGGRSARNRPPITYAQVERFSETMGLPVTVSVLDDFDLGAVKYEDRETEGGIILMGTDEHLLGNYSYELAQGRFFTAQDVHYGRPVTVLPMPIAETLFPNESPLGKEVRFGGHRYQVVGVLEEKGSFLGFNQDNRIFAPITRVFTLYGQPRRNIGSVSVRVHNPTQLMPAMEEATGRMRTIRKVPPGEPNNFEVSTNDSMRSIFDAFTGTLTIGGLVIGMIALLAAGIGVMNIMLVSVTERTREIGIRKSVGARRRDILRQFLFEAFFLCQIGGLLGIALGALVGNGVALYFDITAAFPWGWAIAAVVAMTAVAFVFGGYPAFKAARLDPIESLRYE
ncbi:MAG: FtsX-like permease family protein [Bacteroidetes bacterium]|nr:FtsX-like permease family protein [Bacteroidota bacterium]